jgi:hypothetical protein
MDVQWMFSSSLHSAGTPMTLEAQLTDDVLRIKRDGALELCLLKDKK